MAILIGPNEATDSKERETFPYRVSYQNSDGVLIATQAFNEAAIRGLCRRFLFEIACRNGKGNPHAAAKDDFKALLQDAMLDDKP